MRDKEALRITPDKTRISIAQIRAMWSSIINTNLGIMRVSVGKSKVISQRRGKMWLM